MRKIVLALALIGVINALCDHQSCMQCATDGSCEVCNTYLHYVSDNQGGCTVVYAQFCTLKDDDGLCYRCERDYTPYLGVCKAITQGNCAIYGCDGLCTTCDDEFYLDADNECVAVPPANSIANCVVYDSATTCRECSRGFFSVGTSCQTMPANCLTPSLAGCTQCAPNSFLVTNTPAGILDNFWDKWVRYDLYGVFDVATAQCVAYTGPNCITAQSVDRCALCQPGYVLNASGTCVLPNPVIPNCFIYQSATACQQCAAGFFVNANGGCTQVARSTDNCLYYDSPTRCSRCIDEFQLAELTPISPDYRVCNPVATSIAGCNWYASTGRCAGCSGSAYVSTDGLSCISITSINLITGCLVYSQNSCLFCNAPLYFNSATRACVAASPANALCTRFNNDQTCAECAAGYFLGANNVCTRILLANCRVYTDARTCLYCRPGFYLSGNACMSTPALANCDIYQRSPGANGVVSCFRCTGGFNLVSGACVSVTIQNCAVYFSGNTCAFCIKGYYVLNNACALVNNPIPNCERYANPTTCLICAANSFLNGSGCTAFTTNPFIPDCIAYSGPTTCARCSASYFLASQTQTCEAIELGSNGANAKIENCTYYDDQGRCAECTSSYFLDSTSTQRPVCQLLPGVVLNCDAYENRRCVRCAGDFYLSSGVNPTCLPVTTSIANCYLYSAANRCAQCQNDTLINATNTQCVAILFIISGCQVYNADGTCRFCVNGQYLNPNNGQCLNAGNAVPNCARFANANTCLECAQGFYLNLNSCISVVTSGSIANCKYAASNTSCAICLSTHFVNPTTRACDPITRSVNNCAEYATAQNCGVCNTGFYLVNATTCSPITTGIANCAVYLSATACRTCAPGFVLNTQNNLCTAIVGAGIVGCEIYATSTTCAQCYGENVFSPFLPNQPAIRYALAANGSCVANCESTLQGTTRTNTCQRCIAGSFWNGAICTPSLTTVQNCRYYSANGQCAQCLASYALTSPTLCTLVTGAALCDVVSQNAVGCVVCASGFASNANGQCIDVADIQGCLIHNQSAPAECVVCDPQHYHSLPSNTCVAVPPLVLNLFDELICAWKTQDCPLCRK